MIPGSTERPLYAVREEEGGAVVFEVSEIVIKPNAAGTPFVRVDEKRGVHAGYLRVVKDTDAAEVRDMAKLVENARSVLQHVEGLHAAAVRRAADNGDPIEEKALAQLVDLKTGPRPGAS